MSEPVLVYKGEELAAYGFGDPHPFGTDRHDVFHRELMEAELDPGIRYMRPRRASVDELLLFHTPEYIDKVSRMSKEGRGYLDEGDTPALSGIFDAASDVVGTTLAAVDAVMHGEAKRAFVPIAGLHHAARDRAAGFCVFNDCGVAAEYLRQRHGLARVAYVDIDAHHGDGVFYGFADDPDLIFADIHEDGRYLYPGDAAEPEFIIFQCGADSLEGDPITHLCFTEQAHADAAATLCRLADKHCEGRLVGTGGGGYNRQNIARAWTRVVQAFVEAA
jgi:acetoin utilization protein AcuC